MPLTMDDLIMQWSTVLAWLKALCWFPGFGSLWFIKISWLFQALISVTPDEETYDEEDAAFCLEMLLRIVLENRYDLEIYAHSL